tara:strand:- start:1254 stop:1547 length:294 start_codon:yes stop_codon:yes gene_type:complete
MTLFNKIKYTLEQGSNPPERVQLTVQNIENWRYYSDMLKNGRIKFDKEGILRYNHGAPVGDLVLIRVNKDGTPKYKESAQEWFDPESVKAQNFKWPE